MSDYKDLRRDHPEWPARLKDWVGRSVRLERKMTTRGGTEFKAGKVMRVYSQWRGHLHLQDPAKRKKVAGGFVVHVIRQVPLFCVELLPEKE